MRKRQKVLAGINEELGTNNKKDSGVYKDANQLGNRLSNKKQVHEDPYSDDGVSLESDEEGEDNRIGDVPLWWYDNREHIGT